MLFQGSHPLQVLCLGTSSALVCFEGVESSWITLILFTDSGGGPPGEDILVLGSSAARALELVKVPAPSVVTVVKQQPPVGGLPVAQGRAQGKG